MLKKRLVQITLPVTGAIRPPIAVGGKWLHKSAHTARLPTTAVGRRWSIPLERWSVSLVASAIFGSTSPVSVVATNPHHAAIISSRDSTTRPGTGFYYSLIRMLGIKSVRVDSCCVYSRVNTVYLRGLLTRASNKLPSPKTLKKKVYYFRFLVA
jgi:hypothetical protein